MDKRGFTLLELLIVIVIIGILAAIAIPRYFDAINKARESEARATLAELRKVEQAYFSMNNAYSTVGAGGSLGVDIDGDGNNDIEINLPSGGYYTYDATASSGRAAASPGTSYYMNHADGTFGTY